jgi:hypothetical protein
MTTMAETEPFGLIIQAHNNSQWIPQVLGISDISLMDYAIGKYSAADLFLLNQYRLYLQVISLYNSLTYDLILIHPNIVEGQRVTSHSPTIEWIDFPCPPKKRKQFGNTIYQHLLSRTQAEGTSGGTLISIPHTDPVII